MCGDFRTLGTYEVQALYCAVLAKSAMKLNSVQILQEMLNKSGSLSHNN